MSKGLWAGLFAALVSSAAFAQDSGFVTNLNTPPVSCGSTATLLAAQRVRNAVTITVPPGGVTVYVGSSLGVTVANGFPIYANAALTLQPYNGPVYCVVATGSQTVNFVESF